MNKFTMIMMIPVFLGCGAAKRPSASTPPGATNRPPLLLASSGCSASACHARIATAQSSPLRCVFSAEAIAEGASRKEYRVWSQETEELDFSGVTPLGVSLDFSLGLTLLPFAEGPFQLQRTTGDWVARCRNANEVQSPLAIEDKEISSVNADVYYPLGEVRGWSTQALWATERIRCVENPAMPDSRVDFLDPGTAVWINRLKPNFYFVDGAGEPWIWVNVMLHSRQCYVKAERRALTQTDPNPPPPFKSFRASCEVFFNLESGDGMRFVFPEMKIVESRSGELAFCSPRNQSLEQEIWMEIPLEMENLDSEGQVVSRYKSGLVMFNPEQELPADVHLDLGGISRILEVNANGRGFGPFAPGRLGLVLEYRRQQAGGEMIPGMQMYLRRDDGYPTLVSHLGRCRKIE